MMLSIEIDLLAGRYAATSHTDRNRAEWPPHPARLFSAFVAALHDNEPVDAEEREALLWLEQQSPPSLDVDLDVTNNVGRRTVLDVYVPVNDVSVVGDIERPLREARQSVAELNRSNKTGENGSQLKKAEKEVAREEKKLSSLIADQQKIDEQPSKTQIAAAVALLPDRRTRQVRRFPVVIPAHSSFTLVWPEDLPTVLASGLQRLCDRVTRLGHSSSLVRCTIVDSVVIPTLVPDEEGEHVLRTVGPGQLDRLESEHARHQGVESRTLPARPQRYARFNALPTKSAPVMSIFSNDWIVFERVGGSRPLSSRGTDLTRALRDALIEQHGSKTLPGWLSGHRLDGSPVDHPHVAFVALPFVGHEHADASVQGCAIVPPRALNESEREVLMRLVAGWERDRGTNGGDVVELAGGTVQAVSFTRVELSEKTSLRPATWCRPARRFVTATPIALDRNPGNLRTNRDGAAKKAFIEAQRYVAQACEHIGLPRPISVEISLAPLLAGSQPAKSFAPWPGIPGRTPRVRVHADILFDEPLSGPVILGAGRYFGLGLCRPVRDEEVQ